MKNDHVAFVLDDNSTYSGDGSVYVLTPSGFEKLLFDNDAKNLDVGEHVVIKLSMDELIEAYNVVHGTDY